MPSTKRAEYRGVPLVQVTLIDATRPCWRLTVAAAKLSASRRSARESLSMSVDEAERWLEVVLHHGFTSVLEHCKYTFEVECSRICTHQLVRHRIASYTQQSMRWSEGYLRDAALGAARALGRTVPVKPRSREDYLTYAKVLEEAAESLTPKEQLHIASQAYVIPPKLIDAILDEDNDYPSLLLRATATYYRLLYNAVPREDARFAIPHSVRTRILVTMNARELLESLLPLRLCTRAQWEIRTATWLLLDTLRATEPILWKWAGPRCVRTAQLAGAKCTLDDMLSEKCKPPLQTCPEGIPAKNIPDCIQRTLEFTKTLTTLDTFST